MVDLETVGAVQPIAEHLLNRLRSLFIIDARELTPTLSIGFSIDQNDVDSTSDRLRIADAAMYQAKDKGRNSQTTKQKGLTIRLFIVSTAGVGFFAALIFWPAGDFAWVMGWLCWGIVTANIVASAVYLSHVNPDLLKHRLRLGTGTKPWDKIWSKLFAPIFMSIYVIAGFDAIRFEWSTMSTWLSPLGVALFGIGALLVNWSMGVNPFFEKTVRIQTERGHRVIDHGPYRFVRHPGYLGFFGWCLATPLLLGSWWAFVPAVLAIFSVVIRTALEDRTLREELTGYEEYARRVHYRLIPGLW